MSIEHETSTLNWDTVFAVPVIQVNSMIREQKSSPSSFSLYDSRENNFSGEFGDWQIITGGDGNSIRMNIPVFNFKTFIKDEIISGSFGFSSADLQVQVKLSYVPHKEQESNSAKQKIYDLMIKSASIDPLDPVVIGVCLKNVEGMFTENLNDNNIHIDIDDILKEMFMNRIIRWLSLNLKEFNHVFSVVNLNLYIDSDETWSWCKPSYIDYAYTDVEEDLDKSLLGILCMTGGRKGHIQQQQKLDAYVVPHTSDAGFLISQERFLQEVLLPSLPKKFKNSSTDDYEIINASGKSGIYQYLLKLKNDKQIRLDRVEAHGSYYTPYIKKLELNLEGTELKLETYTETHIFDGVTAYCKTINKYQVVLGTNNKGEQTLTYKKAGDSTMLKGIINEGSALPWIIPVVEIISTVLLAIVTEGGAFLIASIVISLIYGTLALLPEIYQTLNVQTSPSIGLLLNNTVSQVRWNVRGGFKLNYAGLAGPLQLGGQFTDKYYS